MQRQRMILLIPLAVLLVLMMGAITNGFASAGDMNCEQRFFDAEKGCQLQTAMPYEKENPQQIEVATVRGCPANLYDSEKGCQVQVTPAYETEYALVKDTAGDEMTRGCPNRFFDAEKGCQVPVENEYSE